MSKEKQFCASRLACELNKPEEQRDWQLVRDLRIMVRDPRKALEAANVQATAAYMASRQR